MESNSSHKRKISQAISCKAPSSQGVLCPLNCYYVLFIDQRFWFCCVWISDNAQFLLSVCSTSNHKILFILLGHFLSHFLSCPCPNWGLQCRNQTIKYSPGMPHLLSTVYYMTTWHSVTPPLTSNGFTVCNFPSAFASCPSYIVSIVFVFVF